MSTRDDRLPLWHHLNSDNFGFTLFLATALHGVLLLALGFSLPEREPPRHTLDVTLAQHPQDQEPEKADFIAQHNQVGSGADDIVATPTTTERSLLASETANAQAAQQESTAQPETPTSVPTPLPGSSDRQQVGTETPQPREQVAQHTPSPRANSRRQEEAGSAISNPPKVSSTSLLERSLEMASLQAQIDLQRETRTRRPRILRLTSAATRQHEYAPYLDNWRRRVETIGNLNYPEQARSQGIQGHLRLLVALDPDGKVLNVEILNSSGYQILDDAAIRIVQMASPFQSFPVEMRKKVDQLEIIRTWKFEKHAQVY